MDTPYQPTGSGKWIWRKPLTRDVVEFGTLPDPRDARIAQLEAALRWIEGYASNQRIHPIDRCLAVYSHAQLALVEVPPPESDMTITHEDLPA